MSQNLPSVHLRPIDASSSRRSFLRYSGASVVVGSLWLASCKKDDTTTPAPTFASFSPANAVGGTTITITGSGFTGATSLTLGIAPNAQPVSFLVVNDTTITFVVPGGGAATGPITIVTPGGTVTTSPFNISPTAPTISSITPTSALPGAQVTIMGTFLANVTGVSVRAAGTTMGTGTAATIVGTPTATSLTFTIPTSTAAGAATIFITNPFGTNVNPATVVLTVLPSTVSVGSGDAGVLNYAYALEQLEAAFYTQVRAGAYYTGIATATEKAILDDLYYHEVIHRDFFKAAITAAGATPLKDLTVDFSSINFGTRASVLGAAKAFEDLGVAAYNGAGQYITTPAYLLIAGKIVSVEARHAALIRDLLTESTFVGNDIITLTSASTSSVATNNAPANTSLERSMSPTEVVAVANTYLAIGSKIANPGTF
ncbi:MAG: ferritin-like domain-containing protein [Janthinobacterium lividum]